MNRVQDDGYWSFCCALLVVLFVMLFVAFGGLLTGCDSGPIDESGRPLAWVGGQKLTSADLRITGALDESEQRQEALDRGIDDLLVAREARRRGLGYTEQAITRIVAVRRAAELRERQILRDVLFDVVASEVEVSEDEMKQEFDLLNASNRRRIVTLRSQTFASKQLAEQGIGPEPKAVLVGPSLIRELPDPLRKAAKNLESIGARTVVSAGGRWSSVELVAEQAVPPPAFDNARDALEQRLRRRKADDAFERELERLRQSTEIRLEPGVIDNDALWPTDGSVDGSDEGSSPERASIKHQPF